MASELIPNEKNWRRHSEFQQNVLRGLFKEIGYADALLARELPDGRLQLIDGHLRAATTPNQLVPVLILDVTEEEAGKILLTLDPLAALAEADPDRVRDLLATVTTSDNDVQELLMMIAEASSELPDSGTLIDPEPQIDKAEELQRKWCTASGQVWQIASHLLACGDCRDDALVTRLFGKRRARMIWTDPPYGVSYADKNKFLNASDRGNRIQREIINDHLTPEKTEALFAAALSNVVSHCEPGAALYATVPGGPLQARFMRALEIAGFSFKAGLVWVKNQFVIGMSDYHYRHESILYGWLENGPHYFTPDRTQDSVFEVKKPHVSEHHATCKPVELISQMIANSSRPGEIVYDPFCGSGSSLLAAHQLRRIAYAQEIDPGYVAVSLERMSQLGLQPELLN
ncbi:MAG: DNA methyltransferase [Candidatus Binataceae bacterium]|jgi:DNA modification methylase